MITLQELYTLCEKANACSAGLDLIENSFSLEDLYEKSTAELGCWLRQHVPDIPEAVKRKAELKACEEPWCAYCLRWEVQDLPEEIKRKAELKACEEPGHAYWLRRHVKDLPEDVKRMAELKACEDPSWAYEVLADIQNLHPDTIEKLKAIKDNI